MILTPKDDDSVVSIITPDGNLAPLGTIDSDENSIKDDLDEFDNDGFLPTGNINDADGVIVSDSYETINNAGVNGRSSMSSIDSNPDAITIDEEEEIRQAAKQIAKAWTAMTDDLAGAMMTDLPPAIATQVGYLLVS